MKNNFNKNTFGYAFAKRCSALLLSIVVLGTQFGQMGFVFAAEADAAFGVQLIKETGWNLNGASLTAEEAGFTISMEDSENGGTASQLVGLTGMAAAIDGGALKAVFSATALSNGSAVAEIEFTKQNGETETQDIFPDEAGALQGAVAVPAGARTVKIILSGQAGEAFSSISLVIPDGAAPVLTAQYAQGWANQDVTVTLAAQDGVDQWGSASSVEGIYRESGARVSDTAGYSYVATQTETSGFYAQDYAGNKSELVYASVQIDRNAPAVAPEISLSPAEAWAKAGSLTLAAITPAEGESPEIRQYRFNENEWKNYSAPVALPEGEYTVQARAIDSAGNASDVSAAQTARVDATAPEITATALAHTGGSATITTQIQDPVPASENAVGSVASGVAVVKWAAGAQPAEYFAGGGTVLSEGSFTVSAGGLYTVFAQDNAGNTAVQNVEVNMYPSVQLISNQTMDEDASKQISFDVSDPEGDLLTVTAVSSNPAVLPAPVVALEGDTASFWLSPLRDKNGTVKITLSVSDGKNIQTASFDVVVTPVNDAPVAVADSATTAEDTAVSINVLANDTDVDGDALTLKSGGISNVTNGTAVIESGKIKFTPAANFYGEARLTYTVTDGKTEATAEVIIAVTAVNDTPAVTQTVLAGTAEDVPLTGLIAYDVDGDMLDFELAAQPAHGTVAFAEDTFTNNIRRYTYTYTPSLNYNGNDSFAVKVKDAASEATSTVNITIAPVNDVPEFLELAASYNILEDAGPQAISFKIADVETDISALMLQVANLNEDLISSSSVSVGGLGDADPAVTLNYTPVANANGAAQIKLILSDGFAVVNKTIIINIEPQNDAPVAVADTLTYTEDTPLQIDMDNLVKNDTDIDKDTLVFAGVDTFPSANLGALTETDPLNNIWTFTPKADVDTAVTFTYKVTDGKTTAVGTVTLSPAGVNDAPTLEFPGGESYLVDEDGFVDIPFTVADLETASGSLILIAGTVTPALVGANRLSIIPGANGANTLRVAPNENQHGTATVTLTVSDGVLAVTKTLTIVVRPVQDAPVAIDDRAVVSQMGTIQIAALANDSDPDGDSLVIESVGGAADAVITNTGTTITFKDTKGTSRIVTFVYTISDGNENKASGTVRVWVTGKSVAPTITTVPNQHINQGGQTAALPFTVHDPEGAALVVTATSNNTVLLPNNPGNVQLVKLGDGSYTVEFVPVASQYGVADITLSVNDGDNTVSTVVRLTVYRVNKLPVAGNATVNTEEDTSKTINVLAYAHDDDDPNKEKMRVVGVTSPANGRLSLVSPGNYQYRPNDNWNGTDSFTYTITDGEATATGTITVVVEPVNDAPYIWNNIWRQLDDTPGASATISIIGAGIVGDVDNSLSELFVDGVQNVVGGSAVISEDKKSVIFTRSETGVSASFEVRIRDRVSPTDSPEVQYSGWRTVTIGATGGNSLWAEDIGFEKEEDAPAFTVELKNYIHTNYTEASVTINAGNLTVADAKLTGGDSIETAIVTLTPRKDANNATPEYITYTVASSGGAVTSARIYLTLLPVNDAPKMEVDAVSLPLGNATFNEDAVAGSYVLTLSDVDSEFIDFDVYIQNQDPGYPVLLSSGIQVQRQGNTVTFSLVPVENATGEATITLQASDGIVGVENSFTVTFTSVNDVPLAPNYTVAVQEDSLNNPIPVVFANSDADGDALVVAIKQGEEPGHGTVSIADGIISYIPNSNFNGNDSFVYVLDDGQGGIAEGTVSIVVEGVNDDAQISGLPILHTLQEDDPAFELPFTVTDVDGEELEVTFSHTNAILFAGMQLLGSGESWKIAAQPAANAFGSDTVTVTVKDAAARADESLAVVYTFEIQVAAVNDLPVGMPDAYGINEDETKILDVLTNDSDIEDSGDQLKIIAVSATANGGKVENLGGQLKYTPKTNFYGTDSFTYTISDTNNGHAQNIPVTIGIAPVNDAPTARADSASTNEDTAVAIDVLANDTDIEGDPLILLEGGFSANADGTGAVQNGTIAVSEGKAVFTPAANWSGTAIFYYTVSDEQAENATSRARVSITVNPVNDVPEINNPAGASNEWIMLEDEIDVLNRRFVFYVFDQETAAGNLIVTISSQNNDVFPTTQIVLTGSAGQKTITLPQPKKDYNGNVTITITVSDGTLAASRDYTVNVTQVNDAPVISGSASITTNEDTSVSNKVSATDVDNDPLTFSVTTPATKGVVTLNPGTGEYTYKPNDNYYGPDSFVLSVSDGTLSAAKTISVTVVSVNDAPVAANYEVSILEDGTATIDVLADALDIEGNTIALVTTGFFANANGTGTVLNGTASVLNSKVTFKPTANWNGTTVFYYTISDGQAQNATARGKIIVNVIPVNDTPVITGSNSITTNEDTGKSGSVSATDVDGDALSFRVSTAPLHGAVAINHSTGSYTYSPALNYYGSDSFVIEVTDGVAVAAKTITVTVNAVNDAPVAENDTEIIDEDSAIVIYVLANDTDIDGDALALVANGIKDLVGGNAIVSGSTIVFTPTPNYNGQAGFTYTVTDGKLTNTATVTITINPVNDAPMAAALPLAATEDHTATGSVVGTDVDGDILTYTIISNPTRGTAAISQATGGYTYTPQQDHNGPDNFEVQVSDGKGGAVTVVVYVNVAAVNDSPTAQNTEVSTNEDTPALIDVLALASDVDADTGRNKDATRLASSYSLSVKQGGFAGVENGTAEIFIDAGVAKVKFTPAQNWNGVETFTYTIADGLGLTATAQITVEVLPVNDAPVAVDDTVANVQENGSIDIYVLANDTDVDESGLNTHENADRTRSLYIAAVSAVNNGTVAISAAKSYVTFTPSEHWNGTEVFTYTVSDAGGQQSTATVTVTVAPQNDEPVANEDAIETEEDSPVSIWVLANDTDVDIATNSDEIKVVAVSDVFSGTATIAPDGKSVNYAPALNQNGVATFIYTIEDKAGARSSAVVRVTVNAVNDAPKAENDRYTTPEDTAVVLNLLANDTDVDLSREGDSLAIVEVSSVANGTLKIAENGKTVTFTPDADWNGTTSFSYTLRDKKNVRSAAQVEVVVSPVNDAPTAPLLLTPTAGQAYKDGQAVKVTWKAAADVDGDAIVYTLEFYNGSQWKTLAENLAATDYSHLLSATNITSNQVLYRVTAYDSVAKTQSVGQKFIIDNAAPAGVVVSRAGQGSWTNSDVAFSLSEGADLLPFTLQYSLDGASWALISSGQSVMFSARTRVYYRAVDSLGNTAAGEVDLMVDKLSPVFNASAPTAPTNKNVPITLALSADPGGSGNAYVELPGGQRAAAQSSIIWYATQNGTYTFVLVDNAGNRTTATYKVENIKRTPPKVDYRLDEVTHEGGTITIDVPAGTTGTVRLYLPDGGVIESSIEDFAFTATESGEYILEVEDEAGNITQEIITITLPDAVVPAAAPVIPAGKGFGPYYFVAALLIILVMAALALLLRKIRIEYYIFKTGGAAKTIVKYKLVRKPYGKNKKLTCNVSYKFKGMTADTITVILSRGFAKGMRNGVVSIWLNGEEKAHEVIGKQQNEKWSHTIEAGEPS